MLENIHSGQDVANNLLRHHLLTHKTREHIVVMCLCISTYMSKVCFALEADLGTVVLLWRENYGDDGDDDDDEIRAEIVMVLH